MRTDQRFDNFSELTAFFRGALLLLVRLSSLIGVPERLFFGGQGESPLARDMRKHGILWLSLYLAYHHMPAQRKKERNFHKL